jgi:hypothetical protein
VDFYHGQFLSYWLTSDTGQLGDSLARLMDGHSSGTSMLRHDLTRLRALLGAGNDDGAF